MSSARKTTIRSKVIIDSTTGQGRTWLPSHFSNRVASQAPMSSPIPRMAFASSGSSRRPPPCHSLRSFPTGLPVPKLPPSTFTSTLLFNADLPPKSQVFSSLNSIWLTWPLGYPLRRAPSRLILVSNLPYNRMAPPYSMAHPGICHGNNRLGNNPINLTLKPPSIDNTTVGPEPWTRNDKRCFSTSSDRSIKEKRW